MCSLKKKNYFHIFSVHLKHIKTNIQSSKQNQTRALHKRKSTCWGCNKTPSAFSFSQERTRNTNLLWRPTTFNVDPESCNIYQQTNQSDGKEFNLQMSTQNLQKQLNLRLKKRAQQDQFSDRLLLLLLLATCHCYIVEKKGKKNTLWHNAVHQYDSVDLYELDLNLVNNYVQSKNRLGGWVFVSMKCVSMCIRQLERSISVLYNGNMHIYVYIK